MKNYSILREQEYKHLRTRTLNGNILDVGGSKRSGYHELIQGDHEFVTINIDETCEPDFFVNIEGKFPFEDDSFDHAICLNVLEHVFEFENVISETVRTVKKGGVLVIAVPMLHHIHASPDDYFRYTQSALQRMLEKHGCDILETHTLGAGFFSLGFQSLGGALPTNFLRLSIKRLAIFLDENLAKISQKYKKLTDSLPLGYMVIASKIADRY
jgi:SAM-dependent methyltransferase